MRSIFLAGFGIIGVRSNGRQETASEPDQNIAFWEKVGGPVKVGKAIPKASLLPEFMPFDFRAVIK